MLEPSRYLGRFSNIPESFELLGDNLLVEKIKEPEIKTGSGIVIAQATTHKLGMHDKKTTFVRVLRAGKGYYDPETGESIPLDTAPGSILLVAPESVSFYSSFGSLSNYEPETIGIMREGAALLRIKGGDQEYGSLFALLNQTLSKT